MSKDYYRLPFAAKSRSSALPGSMADSTNLLLELWELTKPRLSLLSVITAIVGYLAALPQTRDLFIFGYLVCGTSLAAGGAAVLNQWMEREEDAKMARTRSRPIPSGSVLPEWALVHGILLCASGDLLLWFQVDALAALLALFTQFSYLLIYTPLKKQTPWCTEIGAIPGAIPPLIGWAAAESSLSVLGWLLFAILLFWQIPHFMAIAWIYRKDYARAGFPIASVVEPSGRRISRQAFFTTLLLIISSLLPSALGFTTLFYTLAAVIAGVWILRHAILFLYREHRDAAARKLFLVSIAYLPILLGALVIDRLLLH